MSVHFEVVNGIQRLVSVAKSYWQCKKCEVVGGSLGYASNVSIKKPRFCSYCDEGTDQESVLFTESYGKNDD